MKNLIMLAVGMLLGFALFAGAKAEDTNTQQKYQAATHVVSVSSIDGKNNVTLVCVPVDLTAEKEFK